MKNPVDILKNGDWYHKITLPNGVVTPGYGWDDLWDNIRKTRASVEYAGRSVLDLGSMDGMWAFEAEQLGANYVVTVDRHANRIDNLLFCREQLRSSVIPLFNVAVEDLEPRLASVRTPFDIIQHLGLFYHLEDPLGSFSKCRRLIKTGGLLVLETAAERANPTSCMVFNGVKPSDYAEGQGYWWRMYNCGHPQWMPTVNCLKELLLISGFLPLADTFSTLDQPQTRAINADQPDTVFKRCRVALVARAVEQESITRECIEQVLRA